MWTCPGPHRTARMCVATVGPGRLVTQVEDHLPPRRFLIVGFAHLVRTPWRSYPGRVWCLRTSDGLRSCGGHFLVGFPPHHRHSNACVTAAHRHSSTAIGGPISTELRINDRIRVNEVRLVGPNGEQVGIVRIDDALRLAQEADLDLVEVAPTARPPVCQPDGLRQVQVRGSAEGT
ncbi:MAG: translation initiation factor IF-3 [Nocardioidaceae bacterium]